MKRVLALAVLMVMGSGCYATLRKPIKEVWCYEPVWKQGDTIGTQFAVCQTIDGEAVQVVIAPQPTKH